MAYDLAGDWRFDAPLKVADEIRFAVSGTATMAKVHWFNGLRLPAIVAKRTDDTITHAVGLLLS